MLIKRHDDFGSRLRGYRELPGEQPSLENYNVLKHCAFLQALPSARVDDP